jgi:hypothetical protein
LIPNKYYHGTANKKDVFLYHSTFGPFASIHYAPNVNYASNLNWDLYILDYGMRYNYTIGIDPPVALSVFQIEVGSRLIEGKNNWYINVGTDLAFWGQILPLMIVDGYSIFE